MMDGKDSSDCRRIAVHMSDGTVQTWNEADGIAAWRVTDSNVLILLLADRSVAAVYSPMCWMKVMVHAAS